MGCGAPGQAASFGRFHHVSTTPLSPMKARKGLVPPFAGVKAIAFDLDETLIDFRASRRAGLDAMLAFVRGAGYAIDRDAFLSTYAALIAADDAHYLFFNVSATTE